MKKRICFLLAGVMILSLTACSGDEEPEETPEQQRISRISILSHYMIPTPKRYRRPDNIPFGEKGSPFI